MEKDAEHGKIPEDSIFYIFYDFIYFITNLLYFRLEPAMPNRYYSSGKKRGASYAAVWLRRKRSRQGLIYNVHSFHHF